MPSTWWGETLMPNGKKELLSRINLCVLMEKLLIAMGKCILRQLWLWELKIKLS